MLCGRQRHQDTAMLSVAGYAAVGAFAAATVSSKLVEEKCGCGAKTT